MTNQELNLHYIQTVLIKKLTLGNQIRFSDLHIENLESEHINYHLKRLMDFELVEKSGNFYILTNAGKDYSNLMDDEMVGLEKQPKTGILIRGVRLNKETNKIEHLLMRRLKHPYFGKVGRMTGKVRFGETFKQAAERELYEETGLKAKNFVLEEIFHKLRHNDKKEFVQDVIFYIFHVTNFEGTLINKLPYQENFWLTQEEVFNNEIYDVFDDLKLVDDLNPQKLKFDEFVSYAKGF